MRSSYKILLALCFFVLVTLQPILYRSVELSPDEGYFMFMGDSISQGAIPYLDYPDNKPPGIWYLLALTFQVFGKSICAARLILYITNALSAYILYLLGKEIHNEKLGIISAALFLIGILTPAFDGYWVLTEPFLTLFSLFGILCFIKCRDRKLYMLVCGLAIGIATLFKQSGILILIVIITFYLCNFWIPVNRNKIFLVSFVKNISLLLIGLFIPILFTFIYFWNAGALSQFIDNVVWSLNKYGTNFAGFILIGYQFASFSIVWIPCFASLLSIGNQFIKKSINYETLISIWLLISLCPLLLRQFGHYYLPILPPACLLASLFIINIVTKLLPKREIVGQFRTKYIFALAGMISLMIISIGVSCWGYNSTKYRLIMSLQNQIQTADYVKLHTPINDTILVYPYEPSIYFLSGRDPCVNVIFLKQSRVDEKTEVELLQQIINNNPRYIVLETDAAGNFVHGLPNILDFVLSKFNKETSFGRFDIYVNDMYQVTNDT
jgi:4-amino-4-deoxy-L-arabinose transferase-like glycosyltransferase